LCGTIAGILFFGSAIGAELLCGLLWPGAVPPEVEFVRAIRGCLAILVATTYLIVVIIRILKRTQVNDRPDVEENRKVSLLLAQLLKCLMPAINGLLVGLLMLVFIRACEWLAHRLWTPATLPDAVSFFMHYRIIFAIAVSAASAVASAVRMLREALQERRNDRG